MKNQTKRRISGAPQRASSFYNRVVKRCLDFTIALLCLIVLSPLLLLISLLVGLTSKGGVLFRQKRIGRNGRLFFIFKFRTMVLNAERIGAGFYITGNDDPRITKIGRFLRKTSLDELPQLWNLLRGDMSLIGPRPPLLHLPYDGYENYPQAARARFLVRPGMTGLAQIIGNVSMPWDERIEYDLQYVQRLGFRADLRIFFKTFSVFLNRKDMPIAPPDLSEAEVLPGAPVSEPAAKN